jgi:hypothetical protein
MEEKIMYRWVWVENNDSHAKSERKQKVGETKGVANNVPFCKKLGFLWFGWQPV